MDAPKRIWINPRGTRWVTEDDAREDHGDVDYLLGSEHDRLMAEKRAEIVRLREAVEGAAFQIMILANRLEAHGDDVASPAQEFSSRLHAAIRAMKGGGNK